MTVRPRAPSASSCALGEVLYWEQVDDVLTLSDGFDEPVVELVRSAGT